MLLVALLSLAGSAPPPPNVVLIMADDLGYGDLGTYGANASRTPNLDRLAREGVRFTSFYANGPVCTPTRAALLTGRWQQRVGLEWATSPGQKTPGLPAAEGLLARRLKDAGYTTVALGKWHLGYKAEFGPNAHGFDQFFGLLSGNHDFYSHRERNGEPDLYENTTAVERPGYTTDLLTRRAADFVDHHAREPFFLYLSYNAPHWPFQPPDQPEDIRHGRNWTAGTLDGYQRMVARMDEGIGQVLQALERRGLVRNTLVIFTSDNGGERFSDNGPFFHRKGTLWEGGLRVPCVVRWPARLRGGQVVQAPAITMDLTATILAAAGARDAGARLDGQDLLTLIGAKTKVASRPFFWRIDRPGRQQKAVRFGGWKYLKDAGVEQLYLVDADPGERRDLARFHPEILEDLRTRLARWEEEMAAEKPAFVVK